jgi:hypothetical protein
LQQSVTVTLWRQCWLFIIGSSFFAVGTAPGFALIATPTTTDVLCLVGSWFFTSAAAIQLLASRTPASRSWADPSARADWLSAAIQFVGTLLFNLSTGAALLAHRVPAERRFVWAPNAEGSVAFLVSATLAVVAITITVGAVELKSRDWQAAWVNMVGSLAFGVSAGGAFVRRSGVTADALLANTGTFLGALCFLTAALLILPNRSAAAVAVEVGA